MSPGSEIPSNLKQSQIHSSSARNATPLPNSRSPSAVTPKWPVKPRRSRVPCFDAAPGDAHCPTSTIIPGGLLFQFHSVTIVSAASIPVRCLWDSTPSDAFDSGIHLPRRAFCPPRGRRVSHKRMILAADSPGTSCAATRHTSSGRADDHGGRMKPVEMRLVALALAAFLGWTTVVGLADAAQSEKLYRIGVLDRTPEAINAANVEGFRQGLREL